ncbi:hypothetical protein [Bacillus mojavensis]|nr:hypothetical protein [Bacillus mojavensis]
MKPTITKEQAAELEAMRTSFPGGDNYILMAACDDVLGGKLAKLDLLTLAAALVNGYEVEATPEERVREYYYDLRRAEDRLEERGESGSQFRQGWQSVEETLNLLGIKIEGVNV